MPLIGCEVCLKLQKAYSEALRQYVDAMQQQVDYIASGDFSHARESELAIDGVHHVCVERRETLEHHEASEHKKTEARASNKISSKASSS
jgi:hypothetical protein